MEVMLMKKIKMHQQAKDSIKLGIDKLTELVKSTLGPKGRNVIIQNNFSKPIITNDGVTIAKQVEFEDLFENLGATLCKQIAEKTNMQTGDGTTTAIVLAQSIIHQGLQMINKRGTNVIFLQKALEKYCNLVVDYIRSLAKDITNKKQIEDIATISANNDKQIGRIISMAIEQAGIDGVINVDESKTIETWLEKVDGMQIDSGYLSPYFINDEVKLQCELEDVYIMVYDSKIYAVNQILTVLKNVVAQGASLLIFAEDIEGQALATLVLNAAKNIAKVCAVKLPGLGESRRDIAEDICVLTGARYMSKELGVKLDQESVLDNLGFAKKVIVKSDSTIIREGNGEKEQIEKRIQAIKHKLQLAENIFEQERYQKRIAKLLGGISVIHLGAQSEMELREKKFRMEDAINATKAAIEQGIVIGAGSSLIKASKIYLQSLKQNNELTQEERIAIDILENCLIYPAKQIIYNSGVDDQVEINDIIKQIVNDTNNLLGFNALTCKLQNLRQAGVIDPVKVVRCALQNAVSVASLFLTTDGIIIEQVEQNQNNIKL